jgi:prophage maintenance system killer protein
MFVFLDMNGLDLVADERDVVALMIDVAAGAVDERTLAEWVRQHVKSTAPKR